MILVGATNNKLRLIGMVNQPMTKEEAIDLAAKLAVMADDADLVATKKAAAEFMNS